MFAALAQLVERRLGKAEVGSSNLLGSLNHEAFWDIREAFFRVTENFLLYERVSDVHTHRTPGHTRAIVYYN